jgi:guanylate kinase
MKVLVLVGPSGAGKSTLLRALHDDGVIEAIPSWTTRPRRAEEAGGDIDHRYVSIEEFDEAEGRGHFLEAIEMFGFRYGLPAIVPSPDHKVPAISVRASLLDLVVKHFPDHVVYHVESSFDHVRARLKSRGMPRREREERLAAYRKECSLGREVSDRRWDTSGPFSEVLSAALRAIAEDFQIERSAR